MRKLKENKEKCQQTQGFIHRRFGCNNAQDTLCVCVFFGYQKEWWKRIEIGSAETASVTSTTSPSQFYAMEMDRRKYREIPPE